LTLAQARQRLLLLEADQEQAESSLAVVLGFGAGDRVRPALEEAAAPELPASEADSVTAALSNSKEVKRLESAMMAKGWK
jgi:hypothetical protein